ncbi:hypothetical protein MLD38_025273 [Melastoma candidum]|uniref:Uncharacterized protein n=1 Tax=Melastoma candidum TaxID=119954 RepID=A0ACB9NVU1_9MYRT|nr:hypothetical protein MLD38_025273 [Melastoma candidum]
MLECVFRSLSFNKLNERPRISCSLGDCSPVFVATSRGYATRVAHSEKSSRKMLWYLSALVVPMVGSSYAAVPLYRRFCQATGYGCTVHRRESFEEKIARMLKMQLLP